jgi:hypothetical protein
LVFNFYFTGNYVTILLTSRLHNERNQPNFGIMTSTAPVPWAKSKAKQKLLELLMDESSYIHADGMDVNEIHNSDDIFKQYKLSNFKTNYRNLVAKLQLERSCIEFDQAAFDKILPRNDQTERGYKFWDGHRAQLSMREDVKEKRTVHLTPKQLRQTRAEYEEFPLEILRQHKYQEERRQREKVYWQKKRNDNGRKKHETENRMHDA